MVRSKQTAAEVPQEEEQVEEFGGEYSDEDIGEYVSRDQLKQELKSRISDVKGDEKIAFAALFQLYQKQEQIDEEEDKEIQAIKHKYRLKTEDVLNRVRKVVSGESTENTLISNNDILSNEEKAKQLKTISIPTFWPTVIKNSSFSALISKEEESAIDSIKNILVNFTPSSKEVSIEIHFGQNLVLSNTVLKASLTEDTTTNEIKQTYDTPKWKAHYVRPQSGFLNLFTELPLDELTGLYEYWLNFYQEELPAALAFYFELREGTFHSKTPFGSEFGEDYDDDEDEDDEEEEEAESKGKADKKTKAKAKIQKPEKPECKQQ